MFRIELDRLVEQAPVISESVILHFKREFRASSEIRKPEIAGYIEHTKVYENRDEKMKQIAVDASLMLLNKKRFFKDMIMEEIDDKVKKLIAESKARGSPFLDKNKDGKDGKDGKGSDKKNTIVNPPGSADDDEIVIDVDNRKR